MIDTYQTDLATTRTAEDGVQRELTSGPCAELCENLETVEFTGKDLGNIQTLVASALAKHPEANAVVNVPSFVAGMGEAVSQIPHRLEGCVMAPSRELGVEFADRGVRVNAICPGLIRTPLLDELLPLNPSRRRSGSSKSRRSGEPAEVARAASVWPATSPLPNAGQDGLVYSTDHLSTRP